ncbi:hypothetical protein [Olivibacter jilunii]|uniref:Uncharacterized protein n=1 Tax=Olivibacter jilunii TaxID=985016 RepID=A0ABW6B8P3_9SPHI|nr:hypothetical protein [Olivibacter sp. UJ_SKK_5.1]MDX3912620.1 hypothetical protein [Pseudosphingobacterium sp.]
MTIKNQTVKAACTFAKDLGPKLNPAEPLPHARPPFASSHDFLPAAILNLFDAQFHEAVVPCALEPRVSTAVPKRVCGLVCGGSNRQFRMPLHWISSEAYRIK